MIWLLILVPVSAVGLWLAPRHWIGWAITAASEILWAAYAITLHAPSLLVMSGLWLYLNARGCWVAANDQHAAWTRWLRRSSKGGRL